MIIAKNISKQVTVPSMTISILKGLDLKINKGESVAIVGASGSGKTTLLGLLAGLDQVSSGEIYLDDFALHELSADEIANVRLGRVGFVFQNFDLLPNLTAIENVMLPLEIMRSTNAKEIAQRHLEIVGLKERLKHYPKQLSGGEQQRVAIARAYVTKPKILFADEPTGNLDTKTGNNIIELLFELNSKTNTTLVFVTHDEKLSLKCQRQLHLVAGKLL